MESIAAASRDVLHGSSDVRASHVPRRRAPTSETNRSTSFDREGSKADKAAALLIASSLSRARM
jgi:hypothetical protein